MATTTHIGWTNHTWNPWVGCKKKSAGCKNCYMFTGQRRYGSDPTFIRRTSAATWREPLKWHEPARVFTCSWSDFFLAEADEWRDEAWDIIKQTPHLTYQILTKRPELAPTRLPADWGSGYDNVWLGVSTERQQEADERIPLLITIPARVHFISAEPLLGSLDVSRWLHRYYLADGDKIPQLDWVIVGGESGPDFRPMDVEWARGIRRQCEAAGVALFEKQMSGPHNELPLVIDGRTVQQFPARVFTSILRG